MDDLLKLPTPPPILHAPKYRLVRPVQPQFQSGELPLVATVEYPGPVNSLDSALYHLGGLDQVAKALAPPVELQQDQQQPLHKDAPPTTADNNSSTNKVPLEFDFDPKNRFSHPVQAHIATTNNIVCRVVKRTRKRPIRDAQGQVVEDGVYEIRPVGIEHRLARFRAMADFQYTPQRHAEADPVLDLAEAITNLNVVGIRKFNMPPPNEEFPESAFMPPPVFSRHSLPQIFDMHPAPGSVPITTDSGLTRLINQGRYKIRTVQSILFVQPEVPTGPERVLLQEIGRETLSPVEEKLKKLLDERPCWTRTAILNRLSPDDHKQINANKTCWPMVSYTFAEGPFRDLVIRFGYDPRKDPEARFYQHIVLRNLSNVRTRAQPGTRAHAQAVSASSRRGDKAPTTSNLSHEFDGEHVYSKIGNFQLCDISDPLVRSLIDSPAGVLPACSPDPNEGWYAYDYFDQIRQVLRRKWLALLQGLQVDDDDFDEMLRWDVSNESRAGQAKKGRPLAGATGPNGPRASKSRGRSESGSSAAEGGGGFSSDDSSDVPSSGTEAANDGRRRPSGGRKTDEWVSDQTEDDDDSLDSDDQAERIARSGGVESTRASRAANRAAQAAADAAAAAAEEAEEAAAASGSSSPALGPSRTTSVGAMLASASTTRSSRRATDVGATATPTPGPSGAGRKPNRATLAPWEKPKRKRAQAKQPETEAELFARINRAARKNQRMSAASSLPRIDPETGEDLDAEDE